MNDVNCWNQIDASASSAVIVGGYNNRNSGFVTFLGGGAGNAITQNDSVLVGGWQNSVAAFSAFLGGGNRNTMTTIADSAVLVGGAFNTVSAAGAFIGGGFSNTASGAHSFVGGGQGNIASGDRAVIAGAGSNYDPLPGATDGCFNKVTGTLDASCRNRAEGRRNFIGGGVANKTANLESSVVGGSGNEATGNRTFVGGGEGNVATGDRAVVVGGGANSINSCFNHVTGNTFDATCINTASGRRAFIGGGAGHLSSGNETSVTGGNGNLATGSGATVTGGYWSKAAAFAAVPGGVLNAATGFASFAAGRGARTDDVAGTTNFYGAFVWSDSQAGSAADGPTLISQTQPFRATANNQFAVRARGGVSFKVDTVSIAANATDATAGCSLPAGGAASWSCSSDRDLKEAVKSISPRDVLNKVVSLPMSSWQFRGSANRHISPMAQDFWKAFGLGTDDRHITSSDVSGVALAAIQGMNQKLAAESKAKDAKIATLERELALIKRKLGL